MKNKSEKWWINCIVSIIHFLIFLAFSIHVFTIKYYSTSILILIIGICLIYQKQTERTNRIKDRFIFKKKIKLKFLK